MANIFITRETSHRDMSPLNNVADEKMYVMSVTRDTSHPPIAPCTPREQSPFGDSTRHASTALLSSSLDRGKSIKVAVRIVRDISPGEPVNMCFFLAFE